MTQKINKKRADISLVETGLASTRSRAKEMVEKGFVLLNKKVVLKANEQVSSIDILEVTNTLPFVGRGGEKIEGAFIHWSIDLKNKIVLDIGSSTGGFTDASLKRGADKVFAVDVGHDQLDSELKNDSRVVVMESTDIRKVESLPNKVDVVLIDVSFISLTSVLPLLPKLIKPKATILALVKPQFEVGFGKTNDGIVTDDVARNDSLKKVIDTAKSLGFEFIDSIDSPILGKSGNKEFFIYLKHP